jgi:hypothetical protein
LAFAAAILARVLLATVNLDGGPPRHFVRVLGVLVQDLQPGVLGSGSAAPPSIGATRRW